MAPCVLLMFRFRPRVLVDVSKIDTSTRILGYPISSPIMIAPAAMHMLAHPEGETAAAKAAAACNTIMVLSCLLDYMFCILFELKGND